MQDSNFRKGFRFDHVRNIVKDFEKFKDDVTSVRQVLRKASLNYALSESNNPTPESPMSAALGLSSFVLKLDDDNIDGSSSQRPVGVKKAKLKKKVMNKCQLLLLLSKKKLNTF